MGERAAGKGKVYAGQKAGEALAAMQGPPDFEYTRPADDTVQPHGQFRIRCRLKSLGGEGEGPAAGGE